MQVQIRAKVNMDVDYKVLSAQLQERSQALTGPVLISVAQDAARRLSLSGSATRSAARHSLAPVEASKSAKPVTCKHLVSAFGLRKPMLELQLRRG